MSEYKIISDYSRDQIEYTISHYLKEGWQLAGGISVVIYVNNPDGHKEKGFDAVLYSQAIFR